MAAHDTEFPGWTPGNVKLFRSPGKAGGFPILLIFWCGSFYFGIRHLRLYRQHMIENANALLQDETFEQMQQRLNPFVKNMEIASNLQYLLLFFGVLSYIAWYIIEAINA